VLANILPGLREIRAPLAAGYLWFVTFWVLFQDRINTGSTASGSVDALMRLKETVGPGAVGVAVTFLAYLVGALWEPLSEAIAEGAWLGRSDLSQRWQRFRLERGKRIGTEPEPSIVAIWPGASAWITRIAEGRDRDKPPFDRRISKNSWRRLGQVGQRLFEQTDETLRSRLSTAPSHFPEYFLEKNEEVWRTFVQTVGDSSATVAEHDSARQRVKELEFGSGRDQWWCVEADLSRPLDPVQVINARLGYDDVLVLFKTNASGDICLLGRGDVTIRLLDELSLSARRLVGEEQESFLEASRLEGEVQFRYAVAVPLAVATSVVAFGLGVSVWIWAAATAAGVLAGSALLFDGWRRDRRRNDLLVELLAIEKAKSPTFERLLERAKQATPDVHEQRPLDEAQASSLLSTTAPKEGAPASGGS
jgi:hypothetical protein